MLMKPRSSSDRRTYRQSPSQAHLCFAPGMRGITDASTNAQSADASNAQIRMNNGSRIVFAPHPAASYRVVIK